MSQSCKREECGNKGVFQRILVGVDNTEPAQWALAMAAKVARRHGAALALVHVVPGEVALTPEFAMMHAELAEDHRKAGEALLARAASSIDSQLDPDLLMKVGEASQQIIEAAREWGADLIVIGTHGRGAVAHMLLGSTAESVVRHAHAPVLTIGCAPACDAEKQAATLEKSAKPVGCGA